MHVHSMQQVDHQAGPVRGGTGRRFGRRLVAAGLLISLAVVLGVPVGAGAEEEAAPAWTAHSRFLGEARPIANAL